jgi:methionyl-tRNA formyltransferase
MLKSIILLTHKIEQQQTLGLLLKAHNPALLLHGVLTREQLARLAPDLLQSARLVSFGSEVIVPAPILAALGHGAYNFHPGPPDYPGWAPAHFALYDGAQRFGATAHLMAARVDSGPIVDVESFVIPDHIDVRALQLITSVHLANLFWRLSRDIACEEGALPTRPVVWGERRSTRRMYQRLCEIPPQIGAAELARRVRAFDDELRGIPLTIDLHGMRFRLAGAEMRGAVAARPAATRELDHANGASALRQACSGA